MKAAAFFEYGPPEVMSYADVEDPSCGADEVLVRVRTCGVNHSDLDSRAGTSRWHFDLPMVLGAEFVGSVVEVGSEVSVVHKGDLVTALLQYSCGRCRQCARWRSDLCESFQIFGTTRWGGYGEFVSVPARAVVRLDQGDDPLVVAAGQCAVSTAWNMVNKLARVLPGDLVLVPSGSGGVAGALVQCAKAVGATVVTTVGSPDKVEAVRSLGADAVVSYRTGDLARELLEASGGRRFDAVLDTVGGELFPVHLSVLREDGTLVTCGAHAGEVVPLDIIPLFRNGWHIVGFRVAPPNELEASLQLVRQGKVSVPIARTFSMDECAAAHRFAEERRHVGKVLLVAA